MGLLQHIQFEQVQGIEQLHLDLLDVPVTVLVGANGIGKTKALECLHAALMSRQIDFLDWLGYVPAPMVYETLSCTQVSQSYRDLLAATESLADDTYRHHWPVVFLPITQRLVTAPVPLDIPLLTFDDQVCQSDFFHMNQSWVEQGFQDTTITPHPLSDWFLVNLYRHNPYIDSSQWRDHDVATVLEIAHAVEPLINPDMQSIRIQDYSTVTLQIGDQVRSVAHLSSGYYCLLRLIQSIVAGYRAFQPHGDVRQVAGYVLIDQIETGLHENWQTQLLPALHQAFPRTRFVVSTQSMDIAAHHATGGVYLLEQADGMVRSVRLETKSQ